MNISKNRKRKNKRYRNNNTLTFGVVDRAAEEAMRTAPEQFNYAQLVADWERISRTPTETFQTTTTATGRTIDEIRREVDEFNRHIHGYVDEIAPWTYNPRQG